MSVSRSDTEATDAAIHGFTASTADGKRIDPAKLTPADASPNVFREAHICTSPSHCWRCLRRERDLAAAERDQLAQERDAWMEKTKKWAARAASLESHREELTQAGDLMQSCLSRLIAHLDRIRVDAPLPYEEHMAVLEGGQAVEDWTKARAALENPEQEETDGRG